jgi:hypothetical protein
MRRGGKLSIEETEKRKTEEKAPLSKTENGEPSRGRGSEERFLSSRADPSHEAKDKRKPARSVRNDVMRGAKMKRAS